jgi:hypothetical protein
MGRRYHYVAWACIVLGLVLTLGWYLIPMH